MIKLHTKLSKNCDHSKDLDFLEENLGYKRSFISFYDDIQARQVKLYIKILGIYHCALEHITH
jgi:hypothetical protein